MMKLKDSAINIQFNMPYMEDVIQYTGIVTLKNERRKGYAKLTAALVTRHLIENGICPQWESHTENIASISLQNLLAMKSMVHHIFLKNKMWLI